MPPSLGALVAFTAAGTSVGGQGKQHSPLLTQPVYAHRLYSGVPEATVPPQGGQGQFLGGVHWHPPLPLLPTLPSRPRPPTCTSPCPPASAPPGRPSDQRPVTSTAKPCSASGRAPPPHRAHQASQATRMPRCGGLPSLSPAQTGLPLTPSKAGCLSSNSPNKTQ